jgi:TRAP-type C4-dicarboxylate transport system permease small subunit
MRFLVELEARIVRWTRMVAFAGLAGLLVVSGATMIDVGLRWLANRPIKGLIDITELAVAIVLAACFPLVVAQRQNIAIRFLGRGLGTGATRWLDAFGSALLFVFVALIAWQLVVYTVELAESHRTTWLLRIPVTPYWAIAAAIVALCVPVQAVAAAADIARAITGAPPAREGAPADEGGESAP